MKKVLLFFLLLYPILIFAQTYEQQILTYRENKKESFLKDEFGPLNIESIQYIDYYAPNENYKVTANVNILHNEKNFRMPTYDGTSNEYRRFAVLEFSIEGQNHELIAYQSASLFVNPAFKNYLFLPFLDNTNGNSTYEGGRYIELDLTDIKANKIVIDFNKAYNPYCAYSSGYRCPQPPSENTLEIDIIAGEKKYKGQKNERKVNKAMAKNFSEADKKIILNGDINQKLHVYQTTNAKELEILKLSSSDIQYNDPLLETLKKRMYLTVTNPEHAGVGIAAPQIGINKNLIWVQRFDKTDEPFEFYINPKIIWRSKLTRLGTEGCLSIPDRREEVQRSYAIRLQYWNAKGDIIEENIEGFTAVIFQHEVDHLYGILYPDRLEEQAKKESIQLNEKIKFSIENKGLRP